MEFYGKKKREADRAEADRLEQAAADNRNSAFWDDTKGYVGTVAAGVSMSFGHLVGGAAGLIRASSNFDKATQKKAEAALFEQQAQELRDKADNAKTISFKSKKKSD